MPRTIQVHVQVDRLPNVTDGVEYIQLGLRVSAAICPTKDGMDVAQKGDERLILPWMWRDTPNAADGTWNPYVAASWKVWRVVKGTPNTFDPVAFEVLSKTEAGVDDFDEPKVPTPKFPRFLRRITDEVDDIIRARGLREALEVPGQTGIIGGRTAYGLAESLTSLPSPVPSGMKVWTAATIVKGTLNDDDRFVAVPIFAAGDTAYGDDAFDGTETLPFVMVLKPGATGTRLPATALVHASLPLRELGIPANTPQRMINLANLTIRAKSDQLFEGGDWIAEIGGRIAEAIDPSARAMAVLDATIAEVVQREAKGGLASATRDALRDDATTKDLFRTALTKLHDPVVRPRARRSDAVPAAAASFLEMLSVRMPAAWGSVVPLLFAHAGAENATRLPNDENTRFAATSWARILGAAGVPPSPELNEPSIPGTPARVPLLDSEGEFVEWLVGHWTEIPRVSETKGMRPFEGTSLRIDRGRNGQPTTSTVQPVGVVDVGRIPRPNVLRIPFRFTRATFPCLVEIKLATPGSTRVGTSAMVSLLFESGKTTVRVGTAEQSAPELTDARLVFHITLPAGKEPTIEVQYAEQARLPIDNAEAILAGRLGIEMDAKNTVFASIDVDDVAKPSIDRERLGSQAQMLRAALSLAYAGPMLPALLQGWAPIVGETVTDTYEKEPLAARLVHGIEKLVAKTFAGAFKDAADAAGLKDKGPVLDLFNTVRDEAIRDANRLARGLVPPAFEIPDRITEDALPLAFLIAQLQDFDEKEDLWGRLAGVGVLISRDKQLQTNDWWSLNAASLHVTMFDADGARLDLNEDTAVSTAKPKAGDEPWKLASKVDPVPLTVADVGGVRSALVKYENHSIVGEFEHAPQLDPGTQARVPRRPEAYLFPARNFTKVPALTFGREYGIIPYLIAHGGVLPLPLRAQQRNPVKLKPADSTAHFFHADFGDPGGGYVYVRKTRYLRTVPVGAPRLSDAQWPGVFPGVDSLADEIPLRPPAITLIDGVPARFFVDKARLVGLLSSRSTEDDAAIRMEVGEIAAQGAAQGAFLELRVLYLDPQGAPQDALTVRIKLAELAIKGAANGATGALGLRIDADQQAGVRVCGLKRREHDHADDEPEEFDVTSDVATLGVPVPKWSLAYVSMKGMGDSFDVEPPTIRWARRTAKGLELEADRSILPPELAHATRKVAILDGIGTGAKTGAVRTTLAFRRPSTSVNTYERWINAPTGGDGTADRTDILKRIAKARERASTLGTGDRSFDDPAVAAMFVEVVQLFPARKVVVAPTAVRKLGDDDVIDVDTSTLFRIVVEAGSKFPSDPVTLDPKTLILTMPRGTICEIRVYGAVPLQQPALATPKTAERVSLAVRATWRDVKDGGEQWHLGTPLVLTVEVATDIMSEWWLLREDGAPEFEAPAFDVDLARPPAAPTDRAVIRLVPKRIGWPVVDGKVQAGLRRTGLRYANRAALMPQRWSWRGRPHPELDANEQLTFGTGGRRLSPKLGQFVDAAFLGRADDDIGAVREIGFGRAHVAEPNAVVLLEHDLDRRAGTHLWRFAMRLKSRYAAMRPNSESMLRFSHIRPNKPTQWWPIVVPDRRQPGGTLRALDRPSLMLVVPLTEPLMTGGSVPPLLAVFNQELFSLFNAGDGVEAVIDVARHPFPGVDASGNQKTKYYQEFSPDPIRERTAAEGPVAIRVDGPVGYTFDAGAEAGRFDHAALLVSPVAEVIRPGSFMRLRFRRLETPKLLMARDAIAHETVPLPAEGARFLLSNGAVDPKKPKDAPDPDVDDDVLVFYTAHEGLAFDVDVPTADGTTSSLRFKFTPPKGASSCRAHDGKEEKDGTTVVAAIKDGSLSVSASTPLGGSAQWSVKLSGGAKVEMRVIVSARPKPQEGKSGESPKQYLPVGDVSVRIRITLSDDDPNRGPYDGKWLSILCMPLTTLVEFGDRVAVRVCPGAPSTVRVTAVRMSDFAPPVWCQFAAAMSSFAATGKTNRRPVPPVLPVSELTVRIDGQNFKLGLKDLEEGEQLQELTLSSVADPDAAAQVEELLYAIVTRFVYDAFDRLRERAIGIHTMDAAPDALTFGTRVWPEKEAEEYTIGTAGRVRFLRVLRGKVREKGGFEAAMPQFPKDFFGRETADTFDDPPDGSGMAMGISTPIDWGQTR